MEKIITEDKSLTFRNPEHLEPYHTKSGAIIEALEKHARALRVWEKENPIIFDVCSGLSYSAACALEEIRSHGNNSLVTIYLFENDRRILEEMLKLPDVLTYDNTGKKDSRITCYFHFKNAVRDYLDAGIKHYEYGKLRINIVYGDFRKTIEKIHDKADYLFYAPFSPIMDPELWKEEVFTKLYTGMNDDGKLSTYSYARHVREGLEKSGFKIEKGPSIGRRSPSLVAVKQNYKSTVSS
jgi:hypothetical protein